MWVERSSSAALVRRTRVVDVVRTMLRRLRHRSTLLGVAVAGTTALVGTIPIARVSSILWLTTSVSIGALSALFWVQLDTIRRDANQRHRREITLLKRMDEEIGKAAYLTAHVRKVSDGLAAAFETQSQLCGEMARHRPANSSQNTDSESRGLTQEHVRHLNLLSEAMQRQADAAFAALVARATIDRELDDMQGGRRDSME